MTNKQDDPPAMSPAEIATIDGLLNEMAAIPEKIQNRGGEWNGIKVELDQRRVGDW